MKNVNFNPLFQAIDNLILHNETVLIAIDGNSTSGKSTLAEVLKSKYDANVFHMDDYFRSKKQGKTDTLYGSNIDIERLNKEVIDAINQNRDVLYHSFDCKSQTLSKEKKQSKKQINIIEGAFSMHPKIHATYHLKVLLKSSLLQQIRRIVKRNGFKALKDFLFKWIPNEKKYIKYYHLEKEANFIFKSKH